MSRTLNTIVLAAGLSALLGLRAAPAQTYDPRYPVCIEQYAIDGSNIDCSYLSMAQCAASASGRAAQCYVNPYGPQRRGPALPPRRVR